MTVRTDGGSVLAVSKELAELVQESHELHREADDADRRLDAMVKAQPEDVQDFLVRVLTQPAPAGRKPHPATTIAALRSALDSRSHIGFADMLASVRVALEQAEAKAQEIQRKQEAWGPEHLRASLLYLDRAYVHVVNGIKAALADAKTYDELRARMVKLTADFIGNTRAFAATGAFQFSVAIYNHESDTAPEERR